MKQVKDEKRSNLSCKFTEKRSVLFVMSKILHTRIYCDRKEQLSVTGQEAMFGDDDVNVDLQLEKFGVETRALKEAEVECVLGHGWKIGKRTHEKNPPYPYLDSKSPCISFFWCFW